MITVESGTIGEAWLGVAARILDDGAQSRYDGMPVLELERVALGIEHPDPIDPIIASLADPERLAWMHANFTDHSRVEALGNARSYASRLFDYGAGHRDQVQWVIDRLAADPTSRSATITTFEPLTDTSYIPCVSMLDFWTRDGALEQVVYAHSIDFGSKGYGNLVELAALQHRIAARLGISVGRLDLIVKSAHIYETEFDYLKSVVIRPDQTR